MISFDRIPIEYLPPQRPPFVFVDHLLHYEEAYTRTSFRIPEKGLFVENGRFATGGLVEHMAQSSAARVGYIARYILHIPVTIGFIGSVRKLKVYRHPLCGELLETTVFFRENVFGITLTDMEVRCQGELIATASIKTSGSDREIDE